VAILEERRETVARALVGELEARFPYSAALLSGAAGMRVTDSGQEQNANEESPSRGVVFTVYDGASFLEFASDETDADQLSRDVRAWAARLTPQVGGPPISYGGHVTIAGNDWRDFATPVQIALESVSLAEKLALVRDLQRRIQALDTRIVRAQVRYSERRYNSTYIGRGRLLRQHLSGLNLQAVVMVQRQGVTAYNYLARSGAGGFELARVTDEELQEMVDGSVRLLDAERIEPGVYEVVTDPSVSGVIAHECFGHGVELDLFPKGRARAALYLGKRVAAPGVEMYDDPSVLGAFGSYFFDDEGELARPTRILQDGILQTPISDFASATFTPGRHTPNGRRQDFSRKVYARMSNTFFGRGNVPVSDLIGGVEHGVYLRRMESGMEDPMGWGIQVTAHYGEEIVNGKLTGKLFAPVGISGYVPELLGSINGVGDDFALEAGVCGKGHKEMVVTTVGGPHLRMKASLG
jgi:TldD protein